MNITNNNYSVTQIKDQNVFLIKSALRQVESGTKQTLSRLTGLSVSTCNNILNELLETGEVTSIEQANTRSIGRPANAYVFNGDFKYICCLNASWRNETNTTFFHYIIMDLLENIVEEDNIDCSDISYSEIENLLQQLVIRYPKIDTICFGTSGFSNNSKWANDRIFSMLNGKDIQKDLTSHLNRKIIVENDLNAISYGIYNSTLKNKYDMSSMITVAFFNKKGTGAGIIYKGKILHGYQNFAGEIGYLNMNGKYMDELLDEQSEQIISYVAQIVENITTLLNPATLFLIGEYMNDEVAEKIRTYDYKKIPENVLPEIVYIDHYQNYFIEGLYQIAINSVLNAPEW
ncbi:ROK family protein [Blautia marasmi]|uniref:ROK family protein n=1 Tax=Blautia marasmi TaxID=1917868 RepID=UPI000CF1D51C|nr:ROK family protein [Blautia marasmi]